jgi:hypothetical protein
VKTANPNEVEVIQCDTTHCISAVILYGGVFLVKAPLMQSFKCLSANDSLYFDISIVPSLTIDRFLIGNPIYYTRNELMTTFYKSVTVFTALLGNVLQQRLFLCFWAHVAGWRPPHTNLILLM